MAKGENLLEGVNAKGIDLIADTIIEKYMPQEHNKFQQPLKKPEFATFKDLKDLEKQGYKKEGTGFYRDAEHHLWRVEKDGDEYKLIRNAEEEDNLKQSKLANKRAIKIVNYPQGSSIEITEEEYEGLSAEDIDIRWDELAEQYGYDDEDKTKIEQWLKEHRKMSKKKALIKQADRDWVLEYENYINFLERDVETYPTTQEEAKALVTEELENIIAINGVEELHSFEIELAEELGIFPKEDIDKESNKKADTSFLENWYLVGNAFTGAQDELWNFEDPSGLVTIMAPHVIGDQSFINEIVALRWPEEHAHEIIKALDETRERELTGKEKTELLKEIDKNYAEEEYAGSYLDKADRLVVYQLYGETKQSSKQAISDRELKKVEEVWNREKKYFPSNNFAITNKIFPPGYSIISLSESDESYSHVYTFTRKSDAINFVEKMGGQLVQSKFASKQAEKDSEEIKIDIKKEYEPEKVDEKAQRIQYLAEVNTYIVKALLEAGTNEATIIDKIQSNLSVSAKQAKDIYKEIQNRLTKKMAKKAEEQKIYRDADEYEKVVLEVIQKVTDNKYNIHRPDFTDELGVISIDIDDYMLDIGFYHNEENGWLFGGITASYIAPDGDWEDAGELSGYFGTLADLENTLNNAIQTLGEGEDINKGEDKESNKKADIEKQAMKEHLAEAYQKIMPLIRELAEKVVLDEMPYEEASKELEKHAENEDALMEILMALDFSIEDYEEILKSETKESPNFDKRSEEMPSKKGLDKIYLKEPLTVVEVDYAKLGLSEKGKSNLYLMLPEEIDTEEKTALTGNELTYEPGDEFIFDSMDLVNVGLLDSDNRYIAFSIDKYNNLFTNKTDKTAEEDRKVGDKLIEWDESSIVDGQVEYILEDPVNTLQEYHISDNKTLFKMWLKADESAEEFMKQVDAQNLRKELEDAVRDSVFEDSDLFAIAWDDDMAYFSEILQQKNPEGHWYVSGQEMGWQKREGYKYVDTNDGAEFIREIAPRTSDFSFKIHDYGTDGLYIRLSHHDAPTGEHIFAVPVKPDEIEREEEQEGVEASKKVATYFVFDDATGGEKETTFDDFEYFAKEFGSFFLDKRGEEISKEEALSNLHEVSHVYNPQGIGIAWNDEWDIKASKKVAGLKQVGHKKIKKEI